MNKYKLIYRILIECFIIWFVFEWKNKLIISTISKWCLSAYIVIEPFKIKVIEFVVFLSPYGRTLMDNDITREWMHIFSEGILIVFILSTIVIIVGTGERFLKFIVTMIGMWCNWYIMFGIALLIKSIPQEYTIICWTIAITGFILVQIAIFGFLYGVVLDQIT